MIEFRGAAGDLLDSTPPLLDHPVLAKKYYKLGSELYSSSNYEDALELFKKSYSYSKRHALLYNMGR